MTKAEKARIIMQTLDGRVELPLEIRGESLYDTEIEVVLNGFRYEVE